ncbi:MAG: helix-turn-helix transcriptional regulator [Muribaculaceae bacterium]|nr:helix-turn-helix transcriptional regulator [Muribaculaceae bacterium]MBR6489647.1 helix-turn-helix transcriptional regulator [Muribaculaceae bacterium]
MDIVSRLKLFLEQNGISNSQFADTCVIPRPTLSQLLNGRNKKVSDEVISKIHAAYPALNILWLMFGDGEMFVSGAANSFENGGSQNLSKTPQGGNLFMGSNSADSTGRNSSRQPSTISFDDDASGQNNGAVALSNALQTIARRGGSSPTPSSQGRRIVNIMIFYDDNSFESITPR